MARRKNSKKYTGTKEEVKAIKKAIKATAPYSKNVVQDTARDIVSFAHDEFIKGDLGNAATYYELAAWAYSQIGGIRYWKETRKYRGMAKDIRQYQRKEEGGLVSRMNVIFIGISIILLFFLISYPIFTAKIIQEIKPLNNFILSQSVFILGIIFLFMLFYTLNRIKKKKLLKN